MRAPDALEEQDRLDALHAYGVLDTPPEEAFDALVRAAAEVCEAPIAAVSLIDATRQWFKAEIGLGRRETPRELSFCDHARHEAAVMVVPDARLDVRFRDNALVTGETAVRFYAGAPIRTLEGERLGALCVLDRRPRPQGLTAVQARMLQVLADQVEPQLRLRLAVRDGAALASREAAVAEASLGREARLLTALNSAEVGWWDWDIDADRLIAGVQVARWFAADLGGEAGAPMAAVLDRIHPADRARVAETLHQAVATGEPFREEHRVPAADGGVRWISARGRLLRDAEDRPSRMAGVMLDVSDRKRVEARLREADVSRELALEAARLGRFDHDLETGRRYYDARALQMLGLTLDEAQDPQRVFARMHADDRAMVMEAQAAVCSPERRGLYRATYRVWDDQAGVERWISGVGRTQFQDGTCIRFMGVLEDVTEAKEAEAHRALLMREMNHRLKNTLSLVQAVVSASLRRVSDPALVRADITGRIEALARAHDLLIAQSWTAASIRDVVRETAAALSLPPERLHIEGPAVELPPKAALQLSLVLHELATNATKYGALSRPQGQVRLEWAVDPAPDGPMLRITWREEGGPPVEPPTRQGFGSRLVGRLTEAEFGGEVTLDYRPEGVCWSLRAPLPAPDRDTAAPV